MSSRFSFLILRPALLVVLLAATTIPSTAADVPLSLRFDGRAAVIEGVTPGGTVVVYAKARVERSVHYSESFGLQFTIPDRSNAGRVRVDVGQELPKDAVWAVVDLATGRHLVVPFGSAAARRPLPFGAFQSLGAERSHRLGLTANIAEVLVVRPKEGAWFAVIGDGGVADEDRHADGRAVFAPQSLKNLQARSKATLDRIRRRDVVVIVDPMTLESWSSAEVGE